jgi:TRAP-type transport system periplasmic protein
MKGICKVYVLAVLGLAVVCMLGTVAFAQEKVITLRYSDQFPPTDPHSVLAGEWCKEVEKRTNGKVKVRYYPASSLNSPPQMYESIIQGVVDIGNHVLGYTKGRFPLMAGIWSPFEYPSARIATHAANAAYAKFKPKEFDDVKVMYLHCTPDAVLQTARKPVNKLEDLKGMKIRSMDANAEILVSLGAVPVGMPQAEVYDSLSKGVLDGTTAVYSGMKTWKTTDILKYVTEMKGSAYTAVFVVAMNKSKWNSIPPDQQKIIEKINQEWIEKQAEQWDILEKEGKEYAISQGVKIIKLPVEEQAKWTAKGQPLFDKYEKEMKEKNLPGEEFIKLVRDQIKKAQ